MFHMFHMFLTEVSHDVKPALGVKHPPGVKHVSPGVKHPPGFTSRGVVFHTRGGFHIMCDPPP